MAFVDPFIAMKTYKRELLALKRNFNYDFIGVITKYFPNKPASKTWFEEKDLALFVSIGC